MGGGKEPRSRKRLRKIRKKARKVKMRNQQLIWDDHGVPKE